MSTFILKVNNIVKETADTVSIYLKQPGLKKIKYFPGQYITLVVNIQDRKYRRPYSLSSCPKSDLSHLQVTIKRTPGGLVSNYLIDNLKVGDSLEVIEPMGNFLYKESDRIYKTLFLWAGGSGIAPLLSILKASLATSSSNIVLSYCVKKAENVIFADILLKLAEEYKNRFKVNFHYSRETDASLASRLDENAIVSLINEIDSAEAAGSLHYICGPVNLKNLIKDVLVANKVEVKQILSEDFEKSIDENDFEGIINQTVTIIKFGEPVEVEVIRGKTILEAGLDSLIDISYSCQNGSCGLCYAHLKTGKLKIIGADVIESEQKKGKFPMCCSYPLTHDVVVELF